MKKQNTTIAIEKVITWINEQLLEGNTIPSVINGGGYSDIDTSAAERWAGMTGATNNDDYTEFARDLFENHGATAHIVEGEEVFEDFEYMGYTEEDYTFIEIPYIGEGPEDCRIQIATWDLLN